MRVLITGHKGFIGRHVYADWVETLGVNNVVGIDFLTMLIVFLVVIMI
ncbi:MAG: hypothetical protein CM15mV26_0420 [uncultured marine virus]|nr:MAG: hypothetical protein CM15mV26_0420 [uncultured marine virus]